MSEIKPLLRQMIDNNRPHWRPETIRGAHKQMDEYEAKAKAFDEISKLRRKTIGRVRTVGLLAKFGVATWNVINKHERGESE